MEIFKPDVCVTTIHERIYIDEMASDEEFSLYSRYYPAVNLWQSFKGETLQDADFKNYYKILERQLARKCN